jgi:DNA-binding NarL/FixJ family response regulator
MIPLKELAEAQPVFKPITRRETQVLQHAAHGFTAIETGKAMAISPRTVEVHSANIKRKLAARNMAHAVALWLKGEKT